MEKTTEIIIQIIKTKLEESEIYCEIENDSNLREMGINSIIFIKLVVAIEIEFEIEFKDEDLKSDKFNKVQDVVEYVQARVDMKQRI